MVRNFLVRGMLAGLLAALAAFVFAFVVGEPAVQSSIDLEEAGASQAAAATTDHHAEGAASEDAAHSHDEESGTEVPRSLQRSAGLITGLGFYGVAIGGIFGLLCAYAYGRTRLTERLNAGLVAGLGFVAVVLVPFLKYPANPPAVGSGDTIGRRTGYYMLMLLISVVVTLLAVRIQSDLAKSKDSGLAALVAGAVWFVLVVASFWALPSINEVGDFPAALLWEFRLSSLGTQVVMWGGIAIAFATLTQVAAKRATGPTPERELAGAGH